MIAELRNDIRIFVVPTANTFKSYDGQVVLMEMVMSWDFC